MREDTVNPSWQTENDEDRKSIPIVVSLAGNRTLGGGMAFNLVASSLEPQANAPVETEKEEEEDKSEKRGAAPVAVAETVSGVRKKLFIPAEEALDSARVAAELVMKDAMEALHRTKQRLMEIFHRNSSSQAPPASDEVTKANADDQGDNQQNEKTTAKDLGSIFSEPAMGFAFPLQQRAARINSKL